MKNNNKRVYLLIDVYRLCINQKILVVSLLLFYMTTFSYSKKRDMYTDR
jgi:hypothetical protein